MPRCVHSGAHTCARGPPRTCIQVGETCWPDFENRIHLKYNYREGWCVQSAISASVNLSIVNGSLLCVAQAERLCVLNCRPSVVQWRGRMVPSAGRNGSGTASHGRGQQNGRAAAVDRGDRLTVGQFAFLGEPSSSPPPAPSPRSSAPSDDEGAIGPVRVEGTSSRPPKLAHAFAYSIQVTCAPRFGSAHMHPPSPFAMACPMTCTCSRFSLPAPLSTPHALLAAT